MRVLVVSSWKTNCGIAEFARYLVDAVDRIAPDIHMMVSPEALDPAWLLRELAHPQAQHDDLVVHLNHHDGLHSRWTADHIAQIGGMGIPVVVTYHDTRARLEECPKLQALQGIPSALIIHEPVEGLDGALLWRQGVPDPAVNPANYDYRDGVWRDGETVVHLGRESFKAYPQQPVLGTAGFNFPWKNYDRLAEETGALGWAMVLISNNATADDERRWKARNPHMLVIRKWLPTPTILNYLAGCDATAFMYENANTGTSAAIRLGLAARKPVIALRPCRQFCDLVAIDRAGETDTGVWWVDTWEDFRRQLPHTPPMAWSPQVSAFATAEAWPVYASHYADLYRRLLGRVPAEAVMATGGGDLGHSTH